MLLYDSPNERKVHMTLIPVFGRFLLSLIFILSGVEKIMNPVGTKEYMASKNLPAIPILYIMATMAEVGGGLSVLTGCYSNIGTIILILLLVPTTFIFHNFWALSGGEKKMQQAHFLKNLAIIGGLLLIYAFGPGPYSFTPGSHL
jgi:putative oxidoreductase